MLSKAEFRSSSKLEQVHMVHLNVILTTDIFGTWTFTEKEKLAPSTVEVGLGERVLLQLAEQIFDEGYHLYFDNFFSSPQLAAKLIER